MRAALFLLALASVPARADRLTDLLFDYETGRAFCLGLVRSIVPIAVTPRAEPDAEALAVTPGLAVVVSVDGESRLVTSGPLVLDAATILVRAPSGRLVAVGPAKRLGDGALAEIPLDDALLRAELIGLVPAAAKVVKATVPIFTVADPGSAMPVLGRGSIVERLTAPTEGLLIDDIELPYGAALVTAKGQLAGINFRPHPDRKAAAIAVASETLLAWLRPEGPKRAPKPPAP